MRPIGRVAILGAGTMGHGIAHAAVVAGYDTTLYDVRPDAAARGRSAVDAILATSVELGKITADASVAARQRLRTTTALDEAVHGADIIIEAAPEKIDLKLALLADIERLAPAHTVIASNTSSLSVTEMGAALARPARLAGMHFFNPVHRMKPSRSSGRPPQPGGEVQAVPASRAARQGRPARTQDRARRVRV